MSDLDNETVLRPNGTRDFLPAATLETLRWRARLLAATRSFFDARAYWEVETPLLSRDVVVDANLEPFTTRWIADGATNHDASETSFGDELFLQTSPEFGMKRLLSAGATAIYQITRAMRNGECGRFHNPEFTMIEWYRVGETHHDQMRLVEDLVVELMQLSAEFRGTNRAATARAFAVALDHPFERITYDAAFERYAGTKVIGLSTKELPLLARRRGVTSPPGLHPEDRDGWLNLLLAELVQPHLGRERCTFLYDYPASQAALARIRRDDPPVAERFELYVDGIEICNGYHELTDPDELRERMRSQAAVRAAHGRRGLPEHNRLLDAMESGLPACAGVAAGFDRLVMLAVGAESIAEVIAFPFDRA